MVKVNRLWFWIKFPKWGVHLLLTFWLGCTVTNEFLVQACLISCFWKPKFYRTLNFDHFGQMWCNNSCVHCMMCGFYNGLCFFFACWWSNLLLLLLCLWFKHFFMLVERDKGKPSRMQWPPKLFSRICISLGLYYVWMWQCQNNLLILCHFIFRDLVWCVWDGCIFFAWGFIR